jgi:two-component system, OmpR family, sensor histidine kinase VicK
MHLSLSGTEGDGVDPEMISRLFTKFASKSEQGTRSWAITARRSEAHGGSMWGENNPDDKGVTFGFMLPIAS